MLASLAAPAATMARATPVRATARRVAPGSSFAPKAIPALPARRFARARVATRVVAIDAIPRVRAVARRAAPPRRATRVRAASAGAPGAFDDEKKGPNAFAAALAAAALAGAAVAFAYGEFEPLVGAANADKLAPAQDVARMALVTAKSGAAIAGDAAVELALDAYDAAVLLVARAQDALANLYAGLSAAGGATGIKTAGSVNPLLDPSTPLGSFLTSLVGGAAYFADAAANGQWAKILCYKPFKTVAAVTLTVLRIVVSWVLSGAEFACSMLYATPAYAAAIAIVAIVALRKVVKSAAKTTTRRMEAAATSAAAAPAPVAADASTPEASGATEAEADETELASDDAEPMPMPASAVFEASTRVMTEEEKAIMLRRVQEAKSTTRSTTSIVSESYENSYASSSSSYDASSSSAYGAAVSADASDVDRIYKELTQKYGVESGASGAYAAGAPLPASLPTTTKSSAFDADAFLAAFATDDSSSASYAAAASATEAKYAVTTGESAYAASASSTTTTETKSATKSASASSTSVSTSATSATSATSGSPPPAASASSSSFSPGKRAVSRDKLDLSKVRFDKVGGLLGKAVKAAAESATPAAKDAWRETVELTKVVVPSVPKLVEGSVSNIGKANGKETGKEVTAAAAKSVQVKASADGAEVTVAAAAAAESAETVVETTTTETTVTETVVTVEETAEATFEASTSIESMEETGTVWKKKKKD